MPTSPTSADHPPHRGGVEWRNLNWKIIAAIGGMHVVAVFAVLPQLFSWSGLIIAAVLCWVTAGLGITLCYHRLLTHRSFKTPKWLEYTLTAFGCLSWQGSPVEWVGVHRLHHKHSDSEHDPHSPEHGFTWSHILWMMHRKIEGIEGKEAAKDLLRDKGLRVLHHLHWLPQLILAGLLFGVGYWIGGVWLGLSWVVWGVAVRTIVVFHTTWFVNSASHTWGYQNYKTTGEHSTNLWWVALLSWGEGWHNNHHAHPRSAAHGLRWFEIDPTYWTIKLLKWVGLAKDIKKVAPEQMPLGSGATNRGPASRSGGGRVPMA